MKQEELENLKVSILCAAEFDWFKGNIPDVKGWYWLKDEVIGKPRLAQCIVNNKLNASGNEIDEYFVSVRPVLTAEERLPGIAIGSEVKIGSNNIVFVYLGRYRHRHYYLSKDVLFTHRFDLDSNDWETSDLKKWLENRWWAKQIEQPEPEASMPEIGDYMWQ